MIAALMTAAALQMDPSAFATACMTGGGAPGRVEASSDRNVARTTPVAEGATPLTVMLTINRISGGDRVYVEIDGRISQSVSAGSSFIASGRRIAFMADERKSFDYCMRLHRP